MKKIKQILTEKFTVIVTTIMSILILAETKVFANSNTGSVIFLWETRLWKPIFVR